MKNEAAVEEARRVSSTAGVSGSSVNSSHITIAVLVALLGGIFLMLDSQFDRLHAQYDALHGQFNTLATKEDLREVKEDLREVKEDVRELDKRLVRIEEHLGIGTGSGSPRE